MGQTVARIGLGKAPERERVRLARPQGVGVAAVYVYAAIPDNTADGPVSRVIRAARSVALHFNLNASALGQYPVADDPVMK